MTHVHKKSGQTFEVGSYVSQEDGKTYDMTIISYWKDADTQDVGSPVEIVGFYFGDYDRDTTDYYIDAWLANRNKEIKVFTAAKKYLEAYLVTNEDVLDPPEISTLQESIVECQDLLHDRSWKLEDKPKSARKITRSEYLRQLEDLYSDDKIDDDAMAALCMLADNYPDE